MLKIKDGINLKELEKFDWKNRVREKVICLYTTEHEDCYIFPSIDKIFDLIEAGLVEKCDGTSE